MQILTIAEQIPTKLPLWGEIWGFGANMDFSLVLSDFCGVVFSPLQNELGRPLGEK